VVSGKRSDVWTSHLNPADPLLFFAILLSLMFLFLHDYYINKIKRALLIHMTLDMYSVNKFDRHNEKKHEDIHWHILRKSDYRAFISGCLDKRSRKGFSRCIFVSFSS